MEEARRAVETVRELAPRVGVGTNVVQTAITFVERGDADVVLLAGRYTLLDRSAAEELLPLCAERGVELLAAGVFNSGVLAGGTTFDYQRGGARRPRAASEARGGLRPPRSPTRRRGHPVPAPASRRDVDPGRRPDAGGDRRGRPPPRPSGARGALVGARSGFGLRITGLSTHDVRFPTSRSLDGSDAMHRKPDYSAAYVVLQTDPAAERPRPDLHERPRHRGRASPPFGRSSRSSSAARSRRSPATCAASGAASRRRPAALARPGEGRHPLADGRGRQRRLGPLGEARGQAALEAARRPAARGARRCDRLPLHRGRPLAGRGARPPARGARRARPSARREIAAAGYPAYTTSAGWLGYADEKVEGARRARRSPTASRTSR